MVSWWVGGGPVGELVLVGQWVSGRPFGGQLSEIVIRNTSLFISIPSKNVLKSAIAAISSLVANITCFNLSEKLPAVNLLNV